MKTKKLKCVVTGKILFATGDYYERKLEKANGDAEKLHSSYICKEAKKLLQQGYTVERVRDVLKIADDSLGPVPDNVIASIVQTKRQYYRSVTSEMVPGLINNVVHKTDPDVKKFLETITSKK